MKKILEIKEIMPGVMEVRLEATKRVKIWLMRVEEKYGVTSCEPQICPLYNECPKLKSPLKKYPSFGEFCNRLFTDYPDLSLRLATKYGITNINQVVPIKRR